MIPFRVVFEAGLPAYEQVVYAARKAMAAGQLRPGDPFPSVRALSKALKINPNTAHKVVSQLTDEGLLEVRPGTGTFVAAPPASTRAQKRQLLAADLERLVVNALHLGLDAADLVDGIHEHFAKLNNHQSKEDS